MIFAGVNSFRLQRRLSGDKAAAAHGGNGWLAVEFGTPTVAKVLFLLRLFPFLLSKILFLLRLFPFLLSQVLFFLWSMLPVGQSPDGGKIPTAAKKICR